MSEKTKVLTEKANLAKDSKLRKLIRKYNIAIVLIFMVIIMSILRPNFLSPSNLFNVLTQSSIYGIMSLGLTLIIISKGIDLSAGSLVALSGIVAASLGQSATAATKYFPNLGELPVIVPILAALLVGGILGLINGSVIAYTAIPPFIATLGMTTIARGFTLMYTEGKPVSTLTSDFMAIGGKIGVLPVPVLIYGIMALITWILLNHTRFGKNVYAIGGNVHAAEVSGVNIKKI